MRIQTNIHVPDNVRAEHFIGEAYGKPYAALHIGDTIMYFNSPDSINDLVRHLKRAEHDLAEAISEHPTTQGR